jgi:phosphohistidine phosphatase
MNLYFLRHAHAEDATEVADHKRRLTSKGLRAASNTAKLLTSLKVKPAVVYSSPRVRARQTAEVVAASLGVNLEVRDELDFSFDVAALKQLMNNHQPETDLLMVGHEPSTSQVIGELTGARIQMKKSGIACVELVTFAPLRGDLLWLLSPKITKVIAQA